MTNDCKTCPVSTGTHKPAEAVHQIDEPQAEALRLADECEESATHWAHEIDTRAKAAKMLRAQHTRIAELEGQLIAEAARTAEQKLRADQLEQQHTMQAKMHAQAAEQLAAAQQGVQPFGWFFIKSQLPGDYEFTRDGERANKARKYGYKPVPLFTNPTTQGVDAGKLLAEKRTGMKVDYRGLLGQVQREIERSAPGHAEMLRQLQGHLQELGQRWYAGDTAVVDELLQLYCVERQARADLAAQAKQGGV